MPDFMKAYKHDNDPIRIQRDNNQTNPDDMKLELGSHGGSAPFAAAAMIHLGFDLAILCGCPMDGAGGYANESRVKNHDVSIWKNDKHGRVNGWCDRMRAFKRQQPEMTAKIKSMSGKTKEIFGGIDG
jgi:cephalosporin hydroxylase